MKTSHALLAAACLLFSVTASAQEPGRWNVQFRPAANFPVDQPSDSRLDIGLGLEGTVGFRFMPHLGAYAGWGWNHFSSAETFAGSKMDYEETGYTAGLQFIHPIGTSRFSYELAGGAVYNHIEIENSEGNIIADSGHGFGWQVEAGCAWQAGKHFSLMPNVRYRSLSTDVEIGGISTSMDLQYISAGLTACWNF